MTGSGSSAHGQLDDTLARLVIDLPIGALLVVTALALTGLLPTGRARWLVLLATIGVLGLPHGAVDHLIPSRVRGEPFRLRWLGVIGAVYALVGGLYAAVWFVAPGAAVLVFLLITVLHWGTGDLWPLRAGADAGYLDDRRHAVLVAVTRGSVPIVVPLLRFPDVYRRVLRLLTRPFVADVSFAWLAAPVVRYGAPAAVAVVSSGAVVAGLARADHGAGRIDAVETVVLWLQFLVVPPVVAVATYFAVWHSLRHAVRVTVLHDATGRALDRGRVRAVVGRFARDAAPLTAGALVLLGGLYAAAPRQPTSISGFAALYLVLLAVLTAPHIVVVGWMDRQRGLL